ncbi:hypothetical protein A167_00006 [Alcanivorax sp. S71-1-4]|uniref:hypothetical protein n=1 Tax=Alcanivorax sp. S71-1-4 TaxID=1177159 RepID=UPI00135B5FE9|nr:hypothetical protein [Alcanivorax sp. S71-1-4]KAF0810974.1 hypothetical protein A167_00006 [Alcanivorax sp. S71-1-4]
MSISHSAKVAVANKTGKKFKIQVLHQYTGDSTEESSWVAVGPDETVEVMSVRYRTGFLTTGVDNWIVNGIEEIEVEGDIKLPEGLPIKKVGGKAHVDLRWHSGHGAGSDWKVHTLRSDDADKTTVIAIYPTTIEFQSHSGTSSTTWKPEFDIFPNIGIN